MARIRSIKPDFWTSEQIMECSLNTRLMFIGMWNFADDHGRLPYSPKSIKAQIFPSDDLSLDTIRGMVSELSENGLILIYSVENKEYLEVTGWRHQRIDKPQAPKYPGPILENSENVRGTLPPDRIGEDKKENSPVAKATRTKNSYSEEFESKFWQPYPRSPNMSKSETWKEWLKLDPEKRILACQAIEPYKRFLKSKPNLETVHACRFLSQARFEGFFNGAGSAPAFNLSGHFV